MSALQQLQKCSSILFLVAFPLSLSPIVHPRDGNVRGGPICCDILILVSRLHMVALARHAMLA